VLTGLLVAAAATAGLLIVGVRRTDG